MNNIYDLLWALAKWLETLADRIQYHCTIYWRDYCKHCGVEGGYGHRADCPKAGEIIMYSADEDLLARDWDTPEEDEAWKDL